ncbi:MAG: sugar phosphate isomerase/epimerase [Chitinophagaceae bacterium]|nr:sugar phosphate isomerase/epimerase [Chitinophagaceae bacterium]
MKYFNRRQFLQAGLSFVPFASAAGQLSILKNEPRLCFSTLGCPDWSFQQILDFAAANHYNGIEIRGIKRQLDLTQCPEFNTPAAIKDSMRRVADKNLKIVDLGSSASLHHTNKTERQKNIDEGKRFIDLAEALSCPYVRVFPNDLPKDDTRAAVMELIIRGLQVLGDHARGTRVTVLLESHGDVVRAADLEKIMKDAAHKQVGLIWDITNMWTVTREDPANVYSLLKKYIRHTHIKDATIAADGKLSYVLLGKGDTPIMQAITLLHKDQYKGYYSFEWEKMWHPEIDEPEVALADFPVAIRQAFKY